MTLAMSRNLPATRHVGEGGRGNEVDARQKVRLGGGTVNDA